MLYLPEIRKKRDFCVPDLLKAKAIFMDKFRYLSDKYPSTAKTQIGVFKITRPGEAEFIKMIQDLANLDFME